MVRLALVVQSPLDMVVELAARHGTLADKDYTQEPEGLAVLAAEHKVDSYFAHSVVSALKTDKAMHQADE